MTPESRREGVRKHGGGYAENPRRKHYRTTYTLKKQATGGHSIPLVTIAQLDACADDSARRLLLDKGERFEGAEITFERILVHGRSEADWLEEFARADMEQIVRPKHGRPRLPEKKPVESVPMVDYRHYRGDPRVWRMMELSRIING